MIQSVTVTNPYGESLVLPLRSSLESEGLLIFSITGLGAPKATVNGKGGVGFDGIRVNSVLADARQIILTIAIPSTGITEEIAREKLYTYFPSKNLINLEIETETRVLRIDGYVESIEFNHWAKVENATVSILCPRPYFRDEYPSLVNAQKGGAVPLFEFPWLAEPAADWYLIFGDVIDAGGPYMAEFNYTGISTGAIFTITLLGDIGYPIITNTNGKQSISINLFSAKVHFGGLLAGDVLTLNTRQGEKSIDMTRGTDVFNVFGGINVLDDWIQIHPGLNSIAFKNMDNSLTQIAFDTLRSGV